MDSPAQAQQATRQEPVQQTGQASASLATGNVLAAALIPTPALVLGLAGLLPFIGAAVAPVFGIETVFGVDVRPAVLGYGAVILSFLGGVRWGRALGTARWGELILAVMPSLIGWAALLLSGLAGVAVLVLGFAAQGMLDIRAAREGHLPVWYARLRLVLTLTVVTMLGIVFATEARELRAQLELMAPPAHAAPAPGAVPNPHGLPPGHPPIGHGRNRAEKPDWT